MRGRTRQITYSAVVAALAVCCMLLAQLVTLKTPLLLCSLCFYIALDKSGLVFGILSIIVSISLILLMGFFEAALLTAILFAPYGIIAYFMRRITYKRTWHILFRIAVSVAFANIALASCYFLAHVVLSEIDFNKAISFLGGYWVLAIVVSMLMIITDFFFRQLCLTFSKLIK